MGRDMTSRPRVWWQQPARRYRRAGRSGLLGIARGARSQRKAGFACRASGRARKRAMPKSISASCRRQSSITFEADRDMTGSRTGRTARRTAPSRAARQNLGAVARNASCSVWPSTYSITRTACRPVQRRSYVAGSAAERRRQRGPAGIRHRLRKRRRSRPPVDIDISLTATALSRRAWQ